MKGKKKIWALFDRLRPIIEEKLLDPDIIASSLSQSIFVCGIEYKNSTIAKIIVPLNAEEADLLTPEEIFTALPSEEPYVSCVYPDGGIIIPWEGWQLNFDITLKTDFTQNYMLSISLICHDDSNVVSYGKEVIKGTVAQIAQAVKSDKFAGKASGIFNVCFEYAAAKIEQLEKQRLEERLFADTDINDYDSVMEFVDSIKKPDILKNKGFGLQIFRYDNVVSLIDHGAKTAKVLVDCNRKVKFCTLNDFPDKLLNMIRRDNPKWDLDIHNLSVGQFNSNGLSSVTWVISPYYYCPMDEDGFGEEEEFEVAVTCHINKEGRLIDTPVWKPYSGPRR